MAGAPSPPDRVRGRLQPSPAEGEGASRALPLQGIRVVDSSYVFALPYTGGLMSDMGAEVIKIEGPARSDITRTGGLYGTFPENEPRPDNGPDNDSGGQWWDRSSTYNLINRGKKSLTLDLTTDRGKELFRELVCVSDVVLENYTPRVMRGFGLDYAELRKVRPDIIMASNTGYGHGDGPYSSYPAQATTQEGTHGLCWVTGYVGRPPSKAGASYVDFISTWSAVFAIGAALRHRNLTGEGQWIDMSMYQGGATGISEYLMDYTVNGRLGERIGNRHPHRAPQGVYPAQGNDCWVAISVADDAQWSALCRLMDQPELAGDHRFLTVTARQGHHDELDAIIAGWTRLHDRYRLMEMLQTEGVAASPVFDGRDIHLDPHFRARGFLEKVQFPEERQIGTRHLMGAPYKFSATPLGIHGPAPAFGQHNRWALGELLGVGDSEIESLEQAGAIANAPQSGEPSPTMPLDELVSRGRMSSWDPDYKDRLGIP